MVEPTGCDALADTLAEVATGAASGPDRARVLSHLAHCEDCRRELEELTRIADEVLLIAPEHQPPAGFESAVLAKIAELTRSDETGPGSRDLDVLSGTRGGDGVSTSAGATPISRRRRTSYLAVAAAAAAVVGLGVGSSVWVATSDDRDLAASYRDTLDVANGQYFAAAPLLDDDGDQIGHVFLYQGDPSWVFAALGDDAAPGSYDVVVATDDWTRTVDTCDFLADADQCGGGATVDADIHAIDEVQLVNEDGTTLTATLARVDSD